MSILFSKIKYTHQHEQHTIDEYINYTIVHNHKYNNNPITEEII